MSRNVLLVFFVSFDSQCLCVLEAGAVQLLQSRKCFLKVFLKNFVSAFLSFVCQDVKNLSVGVQKYHLYTLLQAFF
jgi:hypothetical protein